MSIIAKDGSASPQTITLKSTVENGEHIVHHQDPYLLDLLGRQSQRFSNMEPNTGNGNAVFGTSGSFGFTNLKLRRLSYSNLSTVMAYLMLWDSAAGSSISVANDGIAPFVFPMFPKTGPIVLGSDYWGHGHYTFTNDLTWYIASLPNTTAPFLSGDCIVDFWMDTL